MYLRWCFIACVAIVLTCPQWAYCQDSGLEAPQAEVLNQQQWDGIDVAVKKSLTWLATKQDQDGSFQTVPGGQPGVTSLCVMAFAAHGHLPGQGEYGDSLTRAMNYIISCQKQNGLIALKCPDTEEIPRQVKHAISNNAVYNHAISATALSELYGLAAGDEQHAEVIEKAMAASLTMQQWPKDIEENRGGWRYLSTKISWRHQSDLSVTAWQLMFFRSAKNSGFDVPEKSVQAGIDYVLRTFDKERSTFRLFAGEPRGGEPSRAMAGAGILALAHSGVHNRPENVKAADFMLKHPCVPYGQDDPLNNGGWYDDRYHYSAFLTTQAMYQMGGKYWRLHFPPTAKALIDNQSPDGNWPAEKHHYDAPFGNAYTTALVVLTLGAPNQLLPVFQR